MDSGGVATKTKGEIPLFLFPRSHGKGQRKGMFMIDIQSELQSVKIGFESKYITLFDVIEALKKESDSTYSEISQYILLKILPYKPIPDRRFELDTGLDAYRYFQFNSSNYILPYKTPEKLYYSDIDNIYFEELEDLLKMLEAFNEMPMISGAITSFKGVVKYKNKIYNKNPFTQSKYKGVCFKIEDVKRFLEIDFSEYKAKGTITKINNYGNDSLIDDLSYFGSSPINNSIEIVSPIDPENEEIVQLKAQIEGLKQAQSPQYNPMEDVKHNHYNPKERETHLKLIYALTMARTNKDFSASAYFNKKGILKTSTLMNDLISDFEESGISGFSADSLRKRLSEILKIEELQAE